MNLQMNLLRRGETSILEEPAVLRPALIFAFCYANIINCFPYVGSVCFECQKRGTH